MILYPIYNIKNMNEEQMKTSFIYFMGDKDATSKQISEPTRTNNYANIDKDERVISTVKSVTRFSNPYSIKSPDEIEKVSQELLRLSNNTKDQKQIKEIKNRRSYINKYKEFLVYCINIRSKAIDITNKKIKIDVIYDWQNQSKAKGYGFVYIRIYISGLRKRSYMSTGVKLAPEEWDDKLWVVKREDAAVLHDIINSKLEYCKNKIGLSVEDILSRRDEESLSEEKENELILQQFQNINNADETESDIVEIEESGYSFHSDPDQPFISEEKFKEIVDLLNRKKNVILEGAPGVGKTFLARKVAYELMGEDKDENIEMVQFHQSYSYEDFVQGIRPTANGEFKTRDGVFYEFCLKALTAPHEKFIFIIDEINRGNISKILGELMMLIEANKRSPKCAIKLTYTDPDGEKFYVPDNVYILGCMNTADRSLAIVDYALRRRFAFFPIEPEFDQTFSNYLLQKFDQTFVNEVCRRLKAVNARIQQETSLGSGMEIGHSYFCDLTGSDDKMKWWQDICKYDLFPYIREICFDDNDLANDLCEQLTM